MVAEPNNMISEAIDSGIGTSKVANITLTSSIDSLSDVDLFRFELESGAGIIIDLDSLDPPGNTTGLDSYLRIFDSEGNELAFNDDYSPESETFSTDSYLGFIANQTGTYYVGVSSIANSNYNPINGNNSDVGAEDFVTTDYNLNLEIVEVIADEDDNNTISEAIATNRDDSGDTVVKGEIELEADVDLFEFELAAGQGIRIASSADDSDSSLDSYLRIFDGSGNELAFDDNSTYNASTPAEATTDSAIAFAPETPGAYYVGVSSAGNFDYDSVNGNTNLNFSPNTGFSTGKYQLELEVVDIVPDTDDNNTIAEAKNSGVASGGERSGIVNGTIDPELDVDVFRVNLGSGDGVYLDIDALTGLDSQLNSFLRIFDESGNELAFDDNDEANFTGDLSTDSAIAFAPETPGEYFIGVSAAGNFDYDVVNGRNNFSSNIVSPFSTVGNYELAIDIVAVTPDEDPDNTITEATATGISSTGETNTVVTEAIDSFFDVDLYQFQLDAGEGINIDINAAIADSELDSYLRLFDESGNELAIDDDDDNNLGDDTTADSLLNFVADTSGTYFLGISSAGNTDYDAVAGRDNFSNNSGLSAGSYELVMEVSEVIPDTDLDNTIVEATATGISSTGTTSTTIDNAIANNRDVDLYQFQLNQGDTITFDVDAAILGTGLDSVLRLFDSSGVEIANNDDGTASDETSSTDSLLEYTATANGEYYLGVSSFANFNYDPLNGSTNFSNDVGSSSGDYSLTINIAEEI